ncbi:stress response serine/threonine protein kinase YihE [Chromobacterium sphagni]|uniref:Stress response kinase A n=1 Tax=Chromobacterium sphagni TaxID=1903179 RepID=A0A1S1X3B1_9NEIS|nr:serine/threonine protein kinase [Chromobacterium sphagni]OHX13973.1 stress response serine/threonine protein kinase YihE [Chromobacterium sphagni]
MDTTLTPPFATLTPDAILDAVESLDLRVSGSLLALNSYENRVYQIGMDEGAPLVAKFYRPERWSDEAILEEHEFSWQLAEREIPAVPPMRLQGQTLHHHGGFRFALFERRGGRVPELDRQDTLQWIGRFLGRIHALGRTAGYSHRPTLDQLSFGREPADFLLQGNWLPPELEHVYRGVLEQALDGVARCFERAGKVGQLRLHGDCHVGNLLWTDAGPHFVDFDDSRMGPAVQDLWMLLSGERDEQSRQLAEVLAGYEDFCEFDQRELYLLEGLRTLRLIHYSAWLARRWHDPAFPAAFPWFGGQRYWEEQILGLREQIALMDEPPLWSC